MLCSKQYLCQKCFYQKFVSLKQFKSKKMGRNNPKNIKAHNDKLHKEQNKEKAKKVVRAEKLKDIVRKFNENRA